MLLYLLPPDDLDAPPPLLRNELLELERDDELLRNEELEEERDEELLGRNELLLLRELLELLRNELLLREGESSELLRYELRDELLKVVRELVFERE